MSFWKVEGAKAGVVTGDTAWGLLQHAKANQYAIPAFNCTTTSSVNSVLEAGKELNRPVMVQFSEGGACFFAGKSLPNDKGVLQASILGAVCGAHYTRQVAPAYGIPVFLHSDHCAKKLLPWFDGMLEFDEDFFKSHGEPLFSSHMLDLSEEPDNENIAICQKYLKRMAPMKCILEMEIGITGGVEDGVDNSGVSSEKLYSTPEDVFAVYEGLSPISHMFTIAAAFGNVHGVYKAGNVKLEPERLITFQKYATEKTGKKDPLFFVFHGGSGSEKHHIASALGAGTVKMNVDTDTQWAYWEGILKFYHAKEGYLQGQIGNPDGPDKPNKSYYDPRKWVRESELSMVKRVKESCRDLSNTNKTVIVCGGGNAAQVASGLFASRGYNVIAVSFYADEAAKWKAALGDDDFELTIVSAGKEDLPEPLVLKAKIPTITNDPAVAAQADMILLVVPSFAHGEYFEKFAPHMKPGTIVACMPARSGGDILFNAKLGAKADQMVFCGFETLPWACRFTEWGRKATVLGIKNNLIGAITPPAQTKPALASLQGLLGEFPVLDESPNNLGISMRNPGMIVHPGVMYGRWNPEVWDGTPKVEKPLFYQGVDDYTAGVLEGMTQESQATCRKMEELCPGLSLKDACTIKEWYMACYDGQMSDTSSLKACMNTNKGYDGLTHPMLDAEGGKFVPDLKYRYLAEDVPTGLCFAKGLAEIVGVDTPIMDKVMTWAQGCIGLEILKDGKMCGADIGKTRAPQGVGVTTLEAFKTAAKIA